MNKKEIWRMAVEAGLGEPVNHDRWDADLPRLERFAALVAEHEREACAKLRETLHPFDLRNRSEMLGVMNQALNDYQDLIRARGKHD